MLVFPFVASMLFNILFIVIVLTYNTQYRQALRELRARELSAAVIIDGDEHVHMWGKWEDTGKLDSTIIGAVMTLDGQLVLDYSGQKRYCTICGERQIQRPTQRPMQ